jgi:hypothetical protein
MGTRARGPRLLELIGGDHFIDQSSPHIVEPATEKPTK